jgi:hypothetical protein
LTRLSVAAGIWGLWYAAYRGYYAAGGTAWLTGTLARPAEFRQVNLVGAIIIASAAVLAVAVLPLWSRHGARRVLLGLCWAAAVGCCMHAMIDMVQRVLSRAGLLQVHYGGAVWAAVDHRADDLHDLFFNEPWFLVWGLLFAALGWTASGTERARRRWAITVVAATAGLTALGLLSATGVIGRVIVG